MTQWTRKHILIGLAAATWLWGTIAAAQPPGRGGAGPGGAARPGGTERPPGGGYGAGTIGDAVFQIDPDTGALIVITDEQTHEQIQTVVKQLDKPIPQVLIKVLFLEVTHGNNLDMGLSASLRYGGRTRDIETLDPNTGEVLTERILQFQDTLETIFGQPSQGAFWTIAKDDFDMTIHALAQFGKLEVLSRPSILVRNNELAVITLGQEVPFITNSRVTQDGQIINTVEYEDVGIILEVTPHITPQGLVEMLVMPEISTLSGETVTVSQGVEVPIIAKRAAETSVIIPDGMTVVIGGLMEDNETELVRKIPIAGDIPWVGTLFRRTVKSKTKTELIIFVTPHVVRQNEELANLSYSESNKARLAPKVFTESEFEQHLDDYEKLITIPQDTGEEPGLLEKTGTFVRSAVEMLK